MSTDPQISPTTDAFPSDIHHDKPFTIEEGRLKEVDANVDGTILGKTVTRDRDSKTFPISRKQVVKARVQLLALFLCMYLLGWNDGGLGALLPRIQRFYHVSYVVVSLIFVMSTTGFILAALVNVPLTDKFGFGKVLMIGLFSLVMAYTLQIPAFPFPVFLLGFLLNGFGFSLLASGMSGYVAILKENAQSKMCFLHSLYGAGALCSPFVATRFSLMTHWSFFYLTSLGIALANSIIILWVFRLKTQDECLADIGQAPGERGIKDDNKFSQILRIGAVYSLAFFLLLYVGIEVTIGGWTVTYIMNIRHGGPSSGYVSSAFFGGIMLGRVGLVWLNTKIGGRRAIFLYAFVALGLQLVTWFVPSIVGDAIAVSLIGLLLGPMYPLAMAHSGKIIPEWLVTASISLMAGIGQSGSAILPFVNGTIAGRWGIESLQPFLVIMMAVMIFLWFLVPSEMKHLN